MGSYYRKSQVGQGEKYSDITICCRRDARTHGLSVRTLTKDKVSDRMLGSFIETFHSA